MNLKELRKNWEGWGKMDPMWAILTNPEYKGNKWDSDKFFESGRHEIDNQMEFIESKLGLEVDKSKAFDFGCGLGRCTNALAVHFEEVYGIDIALSMIDKAKEISKYPNKTIFKQHDKNELSDFDYGTFSMVFSVIVLQHIDPKFAKKYIEEFLKLLKPRGILLFQTHTAFPKGILPAIKRLVPQQVKNIIYKLANKDEHVMELHHIPKSQIESIIHDGKGKIIFEKDEIIANGYTTSWYYVQKLK